MKTNQRIKKLQKASEDYQIKCVTQACNKKGDWSPKHFKYCKGDLIDAELQATKQTLTENEICSTCGFPKNWEREPAFIKKGIFSLMCLEENTCEECGHQKDGYTIKRIQPLLRKFREEGQKSKLAEVEKVINSLKLHNSSDENRIHNLTLKELKVKLKGVK